MTPWFIIGMLSAMWTVGFVMGYFEGKRLGYLKCLKEGLDKRLDDMGENHGFDR